MKTKKSLLPILAGVLVLMVSACASVPLAPSEMDLQPKTMSAPPDKAPVYLCWNERLESVIITMESVIIRTVNLFLSSGTQQFTSVTHNTDTLNFDAKDGQSY